MNQHDLSRINLILSEDPIINFENWIKDAENAKCPEPTAFTLSTVDNSGKPKARIMLLKEVKDGNFVFFTNYTSPKAQNMDKNPWVALVFCWLPLARQIRIEGRVERVDYAESNAYFQTRPRGSQIGAWASPQSQVIKDRSELESRVAEQEQRWNEGDVVPCPEFWGGFRVIPQRIEFWEGRLSRLHERFVFERTSEGAATRPSWVKKQLAP